MQNENSQIVMEHQLIIQDEKGCRTCFLEHSTYEIGKSCKLPIRLCTQSRLVAPHHATLLRVGQHESLICKMEMRSHLYQAFLRLTATLIALNLSPSIFLKVSSTLVSTDWET
jgi:hypothetical protein